MHIHENLETIIGNDVVSCDVRNSRVTTWEFIMMAATIRGNVPYYNLDILFQYICIVS